MARDPVVQPSHGPFSASPREPIVPRALLAVGFVLSIAYSAALPAESFSLKGSTIPWHAVYAVVEVLAATVFFHLGQQPHQDVSARRGWTLLGTGFLMLAVGAAASSFEPSQPLASLRYFVSDFSWLLSLPVFAAGMLTFPATALGARERRRILLDGLVLTGSAALLLWFIGTLGVELDPARPFSRLPNLMRFVLLGDLLLVYAMAVALVRAPDRTPRWAFPVMLLAIAGGTLGDVFYVTTLAQAAPMPPSSAGNILWIWSAWLAAFAALAHARSQPAPSAVAGLRLAVPSQLAPSIAYLSAALLAGVLVYKAVQLVDAEFRLLAAGGAIVGALVLARLRLALVDNAEFLTLRAQQAEQMREAQKLEAVGRLAGGVAHEFNNLLMVIQQGTDAVLTRHRTDADARDVQSAAARAAELTRQLLTFSRRETAAGSTEARTALTALQPLLQRLVPPDVRLDVSVAESLRPVAIPRGGFDQVLFNLVRNAVDAIEGAGRIVVQLEASPIMRGVRLTVTDSGAGMPETVRERLFEPFFSTKPVGKGTGLGLAIVHGLVHGAGGRISVETDVGKGATFIIDLPEAAPEVAAPIGLGPVPTPPPDEVARVVLLVDDEPMVRRSLRRILERLGHLVHEAEDGNAALAVLEASPAIDLVLTDTVMPQMNGWELIREVRRRRPALPIIRMSGYAEPIGTDHDVQPDLFLAKPFDLTELRTAMRQLAGEPRSAPTAAGRPASLSSDR